MVVVTFEHADGARETIEGAEGQSLMEVAIYGGVDGIDADCGGELACATCHVLVPEEWRNKVGPPAQNEADMLEFSPDRGPGSRLSCQIKLNAALDGLTIIIPERQH